MALPSSGAISLSQVNVELGLSASAQISMNDAALRTLFGVASGAISMSQGYGKANQFAFSFAGGTNVDLRTAALNAGWNGTSRVIATNNGTINSGSTGSYALTISGSFPGGVEFINNGLIVGRGGNGGKGGNGVATDSGSQTGYTNGINNAANFPVVGSGAGPALIASVAVTITNNATIAGGGGGGGGGAAGANSYSRGVAGTGGGGGGGGIGVSSAGAAGGQQLTQSGLPSPGTAGNETSSGTGGRGGFSNLSFGFFKEGGPGGAGGGYGSNGSTGGAWSGNPAPYVQQSPAAGGASGAAIAGNGNISWVTFGNRFGGIS
jgi:hypothetical protein